MKWIEDILKDKFGNSKADTDPLLDEVLWNKVATGLGSPVPGGGSDARKMIGLKWAALGGFVLFVIGISSTSYSLAVEPQTERCRRQKQQVVVRVPVV